METTHQPHASLYRMATPEHLCPWGLKTRALLEREGFAVDDHLLTSRAENDAFKAEQHVKTTPQVFIDGERVGGYEDLRARLGKHVRRAAEPSYRPILAIFGMAAVLAVAASWAVEHTVGALTLRWFLGLATGLLAVQKLQNVEQFSTMFLNYDLLARRWVRYAYIYPFAEAFVSAAMIAAVGAWLAGPLAIVIGGIGAVSVIKAVYVDKRALKCACAGGGSNVPLGFVSLVEDLAMVGMGVWMLIGLAA